MSYVGECYCEMTFWLSVHLRGNLWFKIWFEASSSTTRGQQLTTSCQRHTSGSLWPLRRQTNTVTLFFARGILQLLIPSSLKQTEALSYLIGKSIERSAAIMSSLWITAQYITAHNRQRVYTWRWCDIVCWCDWMLSDHHWILWHLHSR